MPEIASILQIASRGSKLSLALYDFAANVPSATSDASNLARAVKDLSRALLQVSARLREDARITTYEARDVVGDILQQCQSVFTEVEAVVPLDMVRDGKALTYGQKWEWSEVSRAKVLYLLGHMESLKLTLDVMAQAIQSVKMIEMSGLQAPNPIWQDAVVLERMQLESIVMEQQLSFMHASQLFDTYHRRHAESGLQLIPLDQNSQALTLFEEHAPNPGKLQKYQDSALVVASRTASETERVALIRRTSTPYIDYLLDRWTRLQEIRRSQQPRVDSDESSDEDVTPSATYSNGTRSPLGPILTHIDEEIEPTNTRSTPSSPIGIPERLRRPRGPMSPGSPARSWTGPAGNSYFGAPSVKPPNSATNSPRVSFSSSTRPVMSPQPMSPQPMSPKPEQTQDVKKPIPWRLRLGDKYWDHENEKVVNSNTSRDPSQVPLDRNVSTDILAQYVSQDAIEDMGYRYERTQADFGGGKQTRLETLYCIRRALTFAEVEALVERTRRRYEQRYKKPRPQPNLDRSVSSPLPTPGMYLQTPRDNHRSSSRTSHHDRDDYRPRSSRSSPNTSNTSDSDRERDHGSRSRGTSKASSRRESESSTRSNREKKKGSSAVNNLSKVAAGAGVVTLLEGLAEGLAYM